MVLLLSLQSRKAKKNHAVIFCNGPDEHNKREKKEKEKTPVCCFVGNLRPSLFFLPIRITNDQETSPTFLPRPSIHMVGYLIG